MSPRPRQRRRDSVTSTSLPSPLVLLLSTLLLTSTTTTALPSSIPIPTTLQAPSVPLPTPSTPASSPQAARVQSIANANLGGFSVPLYRSLHALSRRSDPSLLQAWALREKARVEHKYPLAGSGGEAGLEKRQQITTPLSVAGYGSSSASGSRVSGSGRASSTVSANATRPTAPVGMAGLYNQNQDNEYFAPVGVGVPPQYMDVILDTGSADFWIASTNCTSLTGCNVTETLVYNTSVSTTETDTDSTFAVRYGSGSASGTIVKDYVGFAGYNVSNQSFALVDTISEGLLTGNVSGLFGLGWQTLAASGVTPWWQNLYQAGVLPFPGFAFVMTRFVNISSAQELEPGGLVTFGYLNDTLYDPPINYVPIPSGLASYWVVPIDALGSNGTNITGVEGTYAAIDTGTTLIGGPSTVVRALYASIPGALAATGAYTGYYSYPCNASINISLTFGGVTYDMAAADFNLGSFGISNNVSTCLGAFFDLSLSSSSRISWVIGAAFLKNVYSVYRANPAAVGFASIATSNRSFYNATNTTSYNGTLTDVPNGIYGPSGVPTSIGDSVTTAIQAGQTISKVPSGRGMTMKDVPVALVLGAVVAVAAWTAGLG